MSLKNRNGHDFSLARAREVIRHETDVLAALERNLDSSFVEALNLLYRTVVPRDWGAAGGIGKIVVTGLGKSGLIGQKIAATFNSTGATSYFLHPVEAVHGDLGVVGSGDTVLMISRSGKNDEMLRLLPSLRLLGVPIILITGAVDSDLAAAATVVLSIGEISEACSLNLAPTSSAVATLALGDALALTLFERRGLKEEDFARFHPGGVLGKRLLLQVKDVMHVEEELPAVPVDAPVREVLLEIVEKRLGATTVVDGEGNLAGIVTDGDLKRLLLRHEDLFSLTAGDVMSPNPQTIEEDALVADAMKIMHENADSIISSLAVVNREGQMVGFLHMYDCLKSGVAS